MSIKKISFEDSPFFKKKNDKFSTFEKDIREIIENKIEYAEFEDFPYAESTANADLFYKARRICRNYFYETYGTAPKECDFFVFSKKNEDGKYKWFVWFNVAAFIETVGTLLEARKYEAF